MKTSKYGFATSFKPDGLYYFQFNDEEGEPILNSRGYQAEKSRDNGIQFVIRHAWEDHLYERIKTKKERYFFILRAANHEEIGRSPMFDTKEEMDKKIAFLKAMKGNVPVYDLPEASGEKEVASKSQEKSSEPLQKKSEPLQKKTGSIQKRPQTPQKKSEPTQKKPEPPRKVEEAGGMPRHKFSVIYYPDSDVWMVKHDFSGNSKQLKTCDGKQIEEFLEAHLPEKRAKVVAPRVETKTAPPKTPVQKGIPQKPDKKTRETVELKIRSLRGEELEHFAKAGNLGQIEIIPREEAITATQPFQAKVLAKSMENNEMIVVAELKDQKPQYGRLLIPIYDANRLKPGMYRITATVHQGKEGEEVHDYSGSRLLMLN